MAALIGLFEEFVFDVVRKKCDGRAFNKWFAESVLDQDRELASRYVFFQGARRLLGRSSRKKLPPQGGWPE